MGKYNELPMLAEEMEEVTSLMDALAGFSFEYIKVDHIQVGDVNAEILGKVQWHSEDAKWKFHPRKHDKQGYLGE